MPHAAGTDTRRRSTYGSKTISGLCWHQPRSEPIVPSNVIYTIGLALLRVVHRTLPMALWHPEAGARCEGARPVS